jgi:hypothetical protein
MDSRRLPLSIGVEFEVIGGRNTGAFRRIVAAGHGDRRPEVKEKPRPLSVTLESLTTVHLVIDG